MNWAILVPIIAQYGLPLAEKLWVLWKENKEPAQADWEALKALASTTAKDNMLAALRRAGIDPNSDQGKALLGLT